MQGQQFGRWKVVSLLRYDKGDQQNKWNVICVCGASGIVSTGSLRSGHSKSCGCLAKERRAVATRAVKTTHGHTSFGKLSPTYISWRGMLSRCANPKSISFKYYGARGIEVCERWRLFENFLADMGDRPKDFSLDRIDVDGNYEPGNCQWADASTQSKNRRFKK